MAKEIAMHQIEVMKLLLEAAPECSFQEIKTMAAELSPAIAAADPAVQGLLIDMRKLLEAARSKLRAAEVALTIEKMK